LLPFAISDDSVRVAWVNAIDFSSVKICFAFFSGSAIFASFSVAAMCATYLPRSSSIRGEAST